MLVDSLLYYCFLIECLCPLLIFMLCCAEAHIGLLLVTVFFILVLHAYTLQTNVQGQRCGSCKDGYFFLDESNQQGCLACFCMGITKQCSSSGYNREVVGKMVLKHSIRFYHVENFIMILFSLFKIVWNWLSDGKILVRGNCFICVGLFMYMYL